MRHVSLPLALPAIASNALFVFMIAWNEFLFALLFLVERRDNWTVSLGLSQLAGSIEVPTTVLMAGSVILTLPIIVLFFLSERWLAGGLDRGGGEGLRPAGPTHHPAKRQEDPVPEVVSFAAPYDVALVACDPQPLVPGSVRVRTWYSGISAGTELTAYRGSNPYLTRTWDSERRLFVDGDPTFAYPVQGWGYSEVGEVVEVADGVDAPAVGDVVHGIWGHRSEAVVLADAVRHRVWTADDAISGTFARVGSIALNAVLAAEARLGDRVAVFGQGVIGLLATRLAVLSGADVFAVDALVPRLEEARGMGASEVAEATVAGGAGAAARSWSGGGGVDAAIE